MDWLHSNSKQKRLRLCGVAGSGGDVSVGRRKSGEVTVGGVLRCGSRICPDCGPRIAAETRSQLNDVMSWWTAGGPHRRLWFGTLTLRHTSRDGYAKLIDAVTACWGAATGGRGWVNDRIQYGVEHYVRVIEEKWSPVHGWHVHVHFVLMVDDNLAVGQPADLLASMFKRWAGKAGSLGLGVPLMRAQDLHDVDSSTAADRLSKYFAKQSTGVVGAESMAWELTGGENKKARRSLTAGQILAWAMWGERYVRQLWGGSSDTVRGVQGQELALLLWSEYEQARKGRRVIAWSRGVREAASVAVLTDEELLEQADAREAAADEAKADRLVCMPANDWLKFRAGRGRLVALEEFVQTGADSAQLVEWFAGYGVSATAYATDEVGVRVMFVPEEWVAELAVPF